MYWRHICAVPRRHICTAAHMYRAEPAHMCRLYIDVKHILVHFFPHKKLFDSKEGIKCYKFYCYSFSILLFLCQPQLFLAGLKNFDGFPGIAHSQRNLDHVGGACMAVASYQYIRGHTDAKKSAIPFKILRGKITQFRRHIFAGSALMG
jgi:hypothetical protein